MKFIQFIHFAFDSFCRRRKVLIFLSFTIGFALFLASYELGSVLSTFADIEAYSQSIPLDHDNVIFVEETYLDVSSELADKWDEFSVELKTHFPHAGGYDVRYIFFEELFSSKEYIDLNSKETSDINLMNDNRYSRVLFIDDSIKELGSLELVNGNTLGKVEEDSIPILVGQRYAQICPIGSKIHSDGKTYVVSGILKNTSSWPSLVGLPSDQCSLYLENCFVVFMNDRPEFYQFAYKSTYVIVDRENVSDSIEQIMSIAREKGVSVSAKQLSQYTQSIRKQVMKTYKDDYRMMGVVLVVILSISIIVSLVGILLRQREYGILYACGCSGFDVVVINVIENLINLVLSVLIMLGLKRFYTQINGPYVSPEKMKYVSGLYYGGMIGVVLLIFGITVIISSISIIGKKPVELLADKG